VPTRLRQRPEELVDRQLMVDQLKYYYIRSRLPSELGIVTLGVTLCVCPLSRGKGITLR